MRSQSSLEFLATYSFLFLILGVVVSVILLLSGAPATSVQSQCSAFAGPTCNLVQIYTNQTAGYTTVTFSLTNSQAVPINVTNTIVTVKSNSYTGACTPNFLYPGEQSTCTTSTGGPISPTTLVQGFYLLNAQFCNSGVANLSSGNCKFEDVQYSGSFASTPSRKRVIIFSVVALQAPSNLQLLPFSKIQVIPTQPNNFTLMQNGAWASNVTNGNIVFAYATNAPMLGSSYYGVKTGQYPSFLSSLQNANVACSSPYNSMLSIASTTLYVSGTATPTVNIEAAGAMEVFYRVAAIGTVWQNVFAGSAWKSQTSTGYTNTISVSKNLYNVQVWWMNPCSNGGQVLQMTNIPS
jgi:hypothetical protein